MQDCDVDQQNTEQAKTIAWFSCGVASAINAHEAIKAGIATHIVYCDTLSEEHQDNLRFMRECEEKLFGRPVTIVKSQRFRDVSEVFEKTRYMSGAKGARCTTELKKVPRLEFCDPYDTHLFGFTADKKEIKRAREFEKRNPELRLRWLLQELGITKTMCFDVLSKHGIRLPEMYLKGYRNNNCIGCVKSSSPGYWLKIHNDFPEIFQKRAAQSREIGCRLVEISHHNRIFLDEMPPVNPKTGKPWPYKGENLSCGPECGIVEDET